jgi:peptidoglycan hydrolase CwlO-like protein
LFYSIFLVDYIQKQLKLQKLQSSIEQQVRVRNEIQQLQRYLEPKKYHKPSKIYETKQELDLTKDRLLEIVNEMDEETIETSGNHLQKQDQTYNYSFNKFKDYRIDKDNE